MTKAVPAHTMRAVFLLPLVIVCSGCSATPPPYKPIADVKTLMAAVMDPVADQYWGAVGTIVDEQGEHEIAPKTAEEWDAVRNAAYIVAESGNLLMMPPRAKDGGEWMRAARRLIETAEACIRAAEARDKQAVFDRGAEMYDACVSCHVKYSPDIVNAAK
jgi:hypothetical protein